MSLETIPERKELPFRQIHLDFHTSPKIGGIGALWDKRKWQETLRRAEVESVTLFAKCHHGWSYHPTRVGRMHPGLDFDLLRAQYEACREIGVQTPIYVSAGVDNLASEWHPEWREIDCEGRYTGWAKSPIEPGFHRLCFHSPYVDYLCEQIREAVALFPECEGLFLDIVAMDGSCTKWALERMRYEGLDPARAEDRDKADRLALERYYAATTRAALDARPDIPVFHNSGHIDRGNRDVLKYFSHLELESLPTGGWGYDHFPVSVKFANRLGLDVAGMTGKFHTTWGEFGGYKHPNALRYECCAMLAFGSKCIVGDQLPPEGLLDSSTYELIGEAYREVRTKEPWARGARNVADIAVLSSESEHGAVGGHAENAADVGAGRVLLEEHLLFDLIHRDIPFDAYRALILPDDIRVDEDLRAKLEAYLEKGGRVMLTGESGLAPDGHGFALDIGADYAGASPYVPDFILPAEGLRAPYVNSPHVVYLRSQRVRARDSAASLGDVHDPWFNRTWEHFCSHQHAPPRPEPSGYDCGVCRGNAMYLAHPVFSLYGSFGAVPHREYIANCIRRLLGAPRVETNLPSTARLNLTRQADEGRDILHLLHANTIHRGGSIPMSGGNVSKKPAGVEVIEDLLPLHDVQVILRPDRPVSSVRLEPQGVDVPFSQRDGAVSFTVDTFTCHQMVVFG